MLHWFTSRVYNRVDLVWAAWAGALLQGGEYGKAIVVVVLGIIVSVIMEMISRQP